MAPVMIVSLGPHFFTSMGGASGNGPTNVSVCEKTLLAAKKIAPVKITMNLQCIFIKLKYKNMTTFLRQTLYGKLKDCRSALNPVYLYPSNHAHDKACCHN